MIRFSKLALLVLLSSDSQFFGNAYVSDAADADADADNDSGNADKDGDDDRSDKDDAGDEPAEDGPQVMEINLGDAPGLFGGLDGPMGPPGGEVKIMRLGDSGGDGFMGGMELHMRPMAVVNLGPLFGGGGIMKMGSAPMGTVTDPLTETNPLIDGLIGDNGLLGQGGPALIQKQKPMELMNLLDQFDGLDRMLMQKVADAHTGLSGRGLPGIAGFPGLGMSPESFQVKTDSQGHFRVRAHLPGYKVHSDGATADGDQPLAVNIVGRSLLIKGRQENGHVTTQFQRAFNLPSFADKAKVSVSYKKAEGELLVDVPPLPGWEKNKKDSQENDEGMMSFSLGSNNDDFPGIMAGADSLSLGQSRPRLRGPDNGKNNVDDLFKDVFGMMMSGIQEGIQEGAQEAAEEAKQKLQKQAQAKNGDAVKAMQKQQEEAEKKALDGKQGTTKAPAKVKAAPLAVVQPKNAKPFWHLGNDGAIDIIAPPGADIGTPDGEQVKIIHPKSSQTPDETLNLPVSLTGKDCQRIQAKTGWILRCKPPDQSVKAVRMSVADEL
eukprot:TRINITY_DN11036_c0_g1_i1.p1 TRINITY_DN11036_c0_g1~~TRINITY_DN11036_c0_g1_i1.p1  ORF type:complete len:561 (-),score=127.50 TRINITY_DN11036_c0_g1_i1:187-1833(-)